MTVSAIASSIYQAAKKAATAAWNWRLQWAKAMKEAWSLVMKKATNEEIAKEIAKEIGGNIWSNYGKIRVYVYKNWIAITDKGIDLSGLGRNDYEEMKNAAHKAAKKHGLEVYEIYRGRKIAA